MGSGVLNSARQGLSFRKREHINGRINKQHDSVEVLHNKNKNGQTAYSIGILTFDSSNDIIDNPHFTALIWTKNSTVKQVLRGHLKIDKNKCLNGKWYLNEGQKYCRMLQGEHSAILLTCIKQ